MSRFVPHSVSSRGTGIEKVLGELEAHVLRAVWKCSSARVRDVKDELAITYKPVSLNAVATVMNRMVAKDILKKEKHNGVFEYQALLEESDFKKGIIKTLLSMLVSDRALFSPAYFADVKEELDAESMRKLRDFLGE